ncbi:type I-E CRISPR-associated endoribonuclease Cas2e [Varibaculum vaginae]|uniref:type I-E CRISPR-associated endoribonuclease Cas2e n=1 Tax=Varibaculum vaginae TaxID=2364797 RepID=UPI001F2091B1|nr:type I-E CRISPR-associated endoribonuclease Cas2e [Varibaculum vaginae]
MVLILTACPPGLRGYVTRWLLEASPGVFVGRLSARVRENLWDLVVAERKQGKALLIYSTNNEQGYAVRSAGHKWNPVELEGMTLLQHPERIRSDSQTGEGNVRKPGAWQGKSNGKEGYGWSIAARRRKMRRRKP